MNRLQLVQELCRLAGITDTGGPTTTLEQSGDYAKAVNYIDRALQEIYNLYFDWNFLWSSSTISTTADLAVYGGQSNLGIWDAQRVHYNNRPLPVRDYRDYVPDTERSTGPPESVVIRPDNQLLIVPTPDDAYTITYDYFRKPLALSANADEPLIPAQFRMVIVGRALMLYANYEGADEARTQGQELYEQYLRALSMHQTPRRAQLQGRAENSAIVVIPV